MRGKKQEIPPYVPEANKMLYWNKTNVIQEPGMELVVPKGMLYDDAELRTRVIGDSNSISFDYVLDIGRTPLHSFCDLSIGVLPFACCRYDKILYCAESWKMALFYGRNVSEWLDKDQSPHIGTFAVGRYDTSSGYSFGTG